MKTLAEHRSSVNEVLDILQAMLAAACSTDRSLDMMRAANAADQLAVLLRDLAHDRMDGLVDEPASPVTTP